MLVALSHLEEAVPGPEAGREGSKQMVHANKVLRVEWRDEKAQRGDLRRVFRLLFGPDGGCWLGDALSS